MTQAAVPSEPLPRLPRHLVVFTLLVSVGLQSPFLYSQGTSVAQPANLSPAISTPAVSTPAILSPTVPIPEQAVSPKTAVPPPVLTPEESGDLLMAHKRYQAAIEIYMQAPVKTVSIWNKIGMAQQQMFSLADAKKSYETAFRMNNKSSDVLNNLGTVYFALKDYANAERFYRKAIKYNPKSALIYKNLGTDLLAENKFKKGWDSYQAALAIDPDVFERVNQYRIEEPTATGKRGAMNYYLAKTYAKAGNTDRAIDCLRRAINEGFTDRKRIMADTEFASLHGLYAFEELFVAQRGQ